MGTEDTFLLLDAIYLPWGFPLAQHNPVKADGYAAVLEKIPHNPRISAMVPKLQEVSL